MLAALRCPLLNLLSGVCSGQESLPCSPLFEACELHVERNMVLSVHPLNYRVDFMVA